MQPEQKKNDPPAPLPQPAPAAGSGPGGGQAAVEAAAPLHQVVQPSMPVPPSVAGKGPRGGPAAPSTPRPGKKPTVEELREALKEVYDPEIPINVVDLGLLYKIEEREGVVDIDLTLTSPHCPIGDQIAEQVRETIRTLPGIRAVNVKLVFEPLWSKDMITADGRLQASMLGLM